MAVLDEVDLDVKAGRIVALLGRSGVGKTALLRVIAGFTPPSRAAALMFGGVPITGPSPDVGFVLAGASLFPWLTLGQNTCFGERMRALPTDVREERMRRLLDDFGLSGLEDRYPDQLSQGQQQRGAIVRSLANSPRLLLADEPFGALDAFSREEARSHFVRARARESEAAVVVVTHDIDEALRMADEVRVMLPGPRGSILTGAIPVERPRDEGYAFAPGYLRLRQRVRNLIDSAAGAAQNRLGGIG